MVLVHERWIKLVGLVLLAVALEIGAGVGMSYLAGFDSSRRALGDLRWGWLVGIVAGLLLALLGSYYATSGIYEVKRGPVLPADELRSVVVASFGGFLAHGGSGLDKYAMKASGAGERDAQVRVSAFAGLEHGVLSLLGTVAGITVLVMGLRSPPADFTVPWAVIPVPGFLLAFWLAARYHSRLRSASGWRGKIGVFLQSILLVRQLFTRDLRRHPAVAGMLLFWLAEMFAIWCGLAAFGYYMNPALLVIGAGTGMLFTRRTGPLAGAGVLLVVLSVTIWQSGAPFAVAVAGVFAYRALALCLPMPVGLAQIPTLQAMGPEDGPGEEAGAGNQSEPALPPRSRG
jgi:hypothetical protein